MTDSIQITHNAEARRFETTIDGHTGYISYKEQGSTLVYDHTMVPKDLGGKGIGSALVKHALKFAQAESKKVDPACSFVDVYIQRHPEYQDLLN